MENIAVKLLSELNSLPDKSRKSIIAWSQRGESLWSEHICTTDLVGNFVDSISSEKLEEFSGCFGGIDMSNYEFWKELLEYELTKNK